VYPGSIASMHGPSGSVRGSGGSDRQLLPHAREGEAPTSANLHMHQLQSGTFRPEDKLGGHVLQKQAGSPREGTDTVVPDGRCKASAPTEVSGSQSQGRSIPAHRHKGGAHGMSGGALGSLQQGTPTAANSKPPPPRFLSDVSEGGSTTSSQFMKEVLARGADANSGPGPANLNGGTDGTRSTQASTIPGGNDSGVRVATLQSVSMTKPPDSHSKSPDASQLPGSQPHVLN
jgi:hypothetical protein